MASYCSDILLQTTKTPHKSVECTAVRLNMINKWYWENYIYWVALYSNLVQCCKTLRKINLVYRKSSKDPFQILSFWFSRVNWNQGRQSREAKIKIIVLFPFTLNMTFSVIWRLVFLLSESENHISSSLLKPITSSHPLPSFPFLKCRVCLGITRLLIIYNSGWQLLTTSQISSDWKTL